MIDIEKADGNEERGNSGNPEREMSEISRWKAKSRSEDKASRRMGERHVLCLLERCTNDH